MKIMCPHCGKEIDIEEPQEQPSPEALRSLMKEKGLTGKAAAEIVGVNPRTVRKWIGGERGIPNAAWRLLVMYNPENK